MNEISDEKVEYEKRKKSRHHHHQSKYHNENNKDLELNGNEHLNKNNNENKMDLYPRRFSSYFQNDNIKKEKEDKMEKEEYSNQYEENYNNIPYENEEYNYNENIAKLKRKKSSIARNSMINGKILNIQGPTQRNKTIEIGVHEEKKIIKIFMHEINYRKFSFVQGSDYWIFLCFFATFNFPIMK